MDYLNGVPIKRMQIQENITAKIRKIGMIKKIVIHDTANRGATARDHFNYFNKINRSASADFFVDWGGIIKVNDYFNYYTWHCGDRQKEKPIRPCHNYDSIGIEICIGNTPQTNKAVANAKILVKELLDYLKLTKNDVIRHYDVSGKWCPGSIPMVIPGPQIAPRWIEFKSGL